MSINKNRLNKYSSGMKLSEGIMLIISLFWMFPIIYQVISSFKNQADSMQPLSFPTYIYLGNYEAAIIVAKYFTLLINSLIVVSLSIALIVLMGSLASYALARSKKTGYKYLYIFFLSGLMIPFQSGMIPLYKMINSLGLIDNILSLVLISIGTYMPMSVLILTGFIKTVPIQIEESAMIDGCSTTRTFFYIVFPLLTPAIVGTIIVSIIPIWNDFLTPLLFLSSDSHKTLPLGMYNFMTTMTVATGPIFGFSVLVCIIPILLFLFLQKYFYKGIVSGAIKG